MPKLGEIIVRKIYVPGTDFIVNINPGTIAKTWIIILFLLILIILLRGRPKQIPTRGQTLLEMLLGWFDGILKESLGKDGRNFLPFIATLFIFVLFCNWMSLIPKVTGPTGDLNLTLGLAILVFLVAHVSAIRKKGLLEYIKGYFRPFWFLFPSNVFSEISKVLSHSFRLYGNIFAGGVIISLIPILLGQINKLIGLSVGIPLNTVVSAFFGIFIGGIQAFVFAMLAVAYISVLRN